MGYEVDVRGTLEFFKPLFEEFKKAIADLPDEPYEIGYFFKHYMYWTKQEDGTYTISRQGKLWYHSGEAMEFLSKYANGTVYFYGEDNESWKYVLKDGEIEKFERGAEW